MCRKRVQTPYVYFKIINIATFRFIQNHKLTTITKDSLIIFDRFVNKINNPIGLRLFLLAKLPAAFFSGVRVRYIDEFKCAVTVPFRWFTTNPFKSTYFACLSMAAEMSTGVLAMGHIYKKDPVVSMLVTKVEGNFFKKATGTVTFISEDGRRIASMIKEAMSSGKSASLNCYSSGKDKAGDTVAEFVITWSFKTKTLQS